MSVEGYEESRLPTWPPKSLVDSDFKQLLILAKSKTFLVAVRDLEGLLWDEKLKQWSKHML